MRVYGGVQGDLRRDERRTQLLEAGLELLGAAEETALTVRGVCQRAGLATRYFYESFADRDALAEAVFDKVITDIAQTALHAVTEAPPEAEAKVRAGLSAIVRTVADDPRRGRLLFATSLSSLLAQRRLRSAQLFASLLTAEAREFYQLEADNRLAVVAQFMVGGLAQTLTAWLAGDLAVDQQEIVDHCTTVFLAVAARQIT
ncbi:TetR/AcrR family transcriptional regulator [Fodinicola acaciae]|uniref:TetR/AcrR family transcriptional regulator n=1 Tax=Fodinicola acaciae TaxID=2681555 RepID=UPI0013D463CE|nr:TetR/AcrR family transcriptional regulator [Fodinicola acaciae]